MGGGFIGGDGSVAWDIFGDKVGDNHESKKVGQKGRRQKGVDATDDGAEFTVLLKLPATLDNSGPAGYVKYTIPIQPYTPDQIQVSWPSSTSASTVKKSVADLAIGRVSGKKLKSSGKRRTQRKRGKRR
jgi:hypothetical protein